jgi:hypothetical protein
MQTPLLLEGCTADECPSTSCISKDFKQPNFYISMEISWLLRDVELTCAIHCCVQLQGFQGACLGPNRFGGRGQDEVRLVTFPASDQAPEGSSEEEKGAFPLSNNPAQ